jgi:hypothetical protein
MTSFVAAFERQAVGEIEIFGQRDLIRTGGGPTVRTSIRRRNRAKLIGFISLNRQTFIAFKGPILPPSAYYAVSFWR